MQSTYTVYTVSNFPPTFEEAHVSTLTFPSKPHPSNLQCKYTRSWEAQMRTTANYHIWTHQETMKIVILNKILEEDSPSPRTEKESENRRG